MRTSAVFMAVATLAVGEVLAGPTHAHLHKEAHKRDLQNVDWEAIDWKGFGLDWESAYKAGKAEGNAEKPAAPSSVSEAGSEASSTAEEVVGDIFSGLLNDNRGASNDRKEFGQRVAANGLEYVDYIGNTGIPYGSNMFITDDPNKSDFAISVKNSKNEPITINIWNKAGSDGNANSGATAAPHDTTLTFRLEPGQTVHVAVDEDTQGALCEATDEITESGSFKTAWLEFNMVKKGPAYNYSRIQSGGVIYKMVASAAEIDCISSQDENSWITATDIIGNGDCFRYEPSLHMKVEMFGV